MLLALIKNRWFQLFCALLTIFQIYDLNFSVVLVYLGYILLFIHASDVDTAIKFTFIIFIIFILFCSISSDKSIPWKWIAVYLSILISLYIYKTISDPYFGGESIDKLDERLNRMK